MSVITIPSSTYSGVRTVSLGALTQNTYHELDVVPSNPLPAGTTLAYRFEHSTDGGATWQLDSGATTVGPQTAADMEVDVGLEVRVANWQERLWFNVSGSSWTTAFTMTTSEHAIAP